MISKAIRNDFAAVSSRSDYYATKGDAIRAFDNELEAHKLSLDFDSLPDFNGNEGRALIPIVNEYGSDVGRALLAWYRMPSGRYEIVGYIT